MATTLSSVFEIKFRLETGLKFLKTSLSMDDFFEDWGNMGLLEKIWTLTLLKRWGDENIQIIKNKESGPRVVGT